jgi:hypothetical protein
MTSAEIAVLVRSDSKHRGGVDLKDADLEGAARFVKKLASRGRPPSSGRRAAARPLPRSTVGLHVAPLAPHVILDLARGGVECVANGDVDVLA